MAFRSSGRGSELEDFLAMQIDVDEPILGEEDDSSDDPPGSIVTRGAGPGTAALVASKANSLKVSLPNPVRASAYMMAIEGVDERPPSPPSSDQKDVPVVAPGVGVVGGEILMLGSFADEDHVTAIQANPTFAAPQPQKKLPPGRLAPDIPDGEVEVDSGPPPEPIDVDFGMGAAVEAGAQAEQATDEDVQHMRLPSRAPPSLPKDPLVLPTRAPPSLPRDPMVLPTRAPPSLPKDPLILPTRAPPSLPKDPMVLPTRAPPSLPKETLIIPSRAPPSIPKQGLMMEELSMLIQGGKDDS